MNGQIFKLTLKLMGTLNLFISLHKHKQFHAFALNIAHIEINSRLFLLKK